MKNTIFCMILFLILPFSCSTFSGSFVNRQRDLKNFDKYTDIIDEFIYYNISLKFKLEFDGDWHIKNEYKHFDRFQKKYASFFVSEESEVLFIGFNEVKKIGIKATAEKSTLSPKDYFEELRSVSGSVLMQYKPVFIKTDDLTLQNIGTYHAEYEVTLNNSSFTFFTILFKKDNFIIKLDIWSDKEKFADNSVYIDTILQSIDTLDDRQVEELTRDKKN